MEITIVQPSPILRQAILARKQNPTDSPNKRVQFDDDVAEPAQPAEKVKDKRPRKSNRDSLKIRYRTGKPGTRRHQRWKNEMYLGYDWSDLSESEQEEEDIFEIFQEVHERPHFSFTETFDENKETLEPFWYDNSEDLIWPSSLDSSFQTREATQRKCVHPATRYRRIPRRSRKQLESNSDSLFLEELERDIQNYLEILSIYDESVFDFQLNNDKSLELENDSLDDKFLSHSTTFEASMKDGKLVIYFQDSLARLMAHGVCKYYSLESQSWNDEKSQRATTIQIPSSLNKFPVLPGQTLRDFFRSEIESSSSDH